MLIRCHNSNILLATLQEEVEVAWAQLCVASMLNVKHPSLLWVPPCAPSPKTTKTDDALRLSGYTNIEQSKSTMNVGLMKPHGSLDTLCLIVCVFISLNKYTYLTNSTQLFETFLKTSRTDLNWSVRPASDNPWEI